MHITERKVRDVVVLDLMGRLTIDEGADPLRDKFNSVISAGYTKVLLNMSGVAHVDSGALGKLVSCSLRAQRANRTVKLFGLTGRVVELLKTTKLIEVFDTYDTEQEALASLMVTT
jgi:anti-sigma B factor antagonist